MSSRQLRKLQKQRELEQLQEAKAVAAESSEDDEPEPAPIKPRQSLFAALGGGDDENDEDEDDAQEEANPEPEPEPVPQPAKKKNKKKKKKGKKQVAQSKDDSGKSGDDKDDEIDRALQELSAARDADSAATDNLAQRSRDVDELLQINTQYLRAINEMRALFGKEAIQTAQEEERNEQAAARRAMRPNQGIDLETFLRGDPRNKLPEISLRRNVFIQGKDTWPRATAVGLVMKEIRKSSDGLTEFAFVHEQAYDNVQIMFFSCVQLGDPMQMVHLLARYPYHISTLLQVSKFAGQQDQNPALAADLCERALFTFGRATTSAFRQKLEQGKARLDFRRPENREFWLAGHTYLKSLIRKGTYRTALEWAKLLYGLNPNDPYGMKYFIHVLAIRARQAQWLADFINTPDYVTDETDDTYVKQTLVLAKLQLGDIEGAKIHAVAGMERMPWLYCSLFQALNLEAPPPLWGVQPDTDEGEFWTKLYVHQAKDIWNNTQAVDLLKEAVKMAKKPTQRLPHDRPADTRTARWAWLEDTPSLLSGIPRAILNQEPNYAFDPLPPPKEANIFTSQGTQMPWRQSSGPSEQGMLAQERALINMIRRQQQRAAARGAGAGAAAGAGPGAMGMLGAFPEDDDDENVGGNAWDGVFVDELDELEQLGEDDDEAEGEGLQPGIVERLTSLLASMVPGGWPAEERDPDDEEMPPLVDGDESDEEHQPQPPGGFN